MYIKPAIDALPSRPFKNIPSNIIDNLMEGCQLIGHDGRYLYLNGAAARHAKKTRDELLGKTMWEAFPGVENTHLYTVLQRCLKLRQPQIMENAFSYADGTRAFFELRFEPVPEGVFILSMDITRRKCAETQALQLNLRLEKLTGVIQDLSHKLSGDEIILSLKTACRELFSSDEAMIYHMENRSESDHDNLSQFVEHWACEQAIANNEILSVEQIQADGRLPDNIKQVSSFQSMLIAPFIDRPQLGALGLFWKKPRTISEEDIHVFRALCDSTLVALERVKIYNDLESSHRHYRDLVENLNDVVFFLNSRRQIVYISPVVSNFGYTAEHLIGREFSDFVFPEDIPLINQRFSGALSGHKGAVEFRLMDKRGAVRYVRVSSRALIQDGQAVGLTGVIVDLTRKRETEEKLKAAQRLETIGTLAGGIAHDFNNILSSIIGFTQLSQDETDPDSELGTFLDEIYMAGNRAKELVRQILTFARQSDVEIQPLQVSTIAREVVNFIRSSTPANIIIRSDIQSRSMIMGNSTQIHQVFMNLLTNAIHAVENQDEGKIDIEIKDVFIDKKQKKASFECDPGLYLFIRVRDTGMGIDPDILPHVFEPYFSTKETGKGTGMGLSIVHGIIQSYKGHIQAESSRGSGSTFTIYFPATDERIIHSNDVKQETPRGNERILFVDDEAALVRMSAKALHRLGYQVTTCTSSTEALGMFRNKPNDFDLVITDMTMPSLTGDKLAVEILKIREDIPVILCTGYSKNISKRKAEDIGIKALVHKPILKAEIASVIRRILNESQGVEHA